MITKNIPFESRDQNGLTLANAEILRESIIGAKSSNKFFESGLAFLKDSLND
jgi:hypothetical protein